MRFPTRATGTGWRSSAAAGFKRRTSSVLGQAKVRIGDKQWKATLKQSQRRSHGSRTVFVSYSIEGRLELKVSFLKLLPDRMGNDRRRRWFPASHVLSPFTAIRHLLGPQEPGCVQS